MIVSSIVCYYLDIFITEADIEKKYGVIDRVSPEDTVKWYQAINDIFEKYGISRSAWSYKQIDFGLPQRKPAPYISYLDTLSLGLKRSGTKLVTKQASS